MSGISVTSPSGRTIRALPRRRGGHERAARQAPQRRVMADVTHDRVPRPFRHRRLDGTRVFLATLLIALVALVATASPASAHTGFESSSPSDGASVLDPVSDITLRFSGPAEPSGSGFVVLGPQGTPRVPEVRSNDDRTEWILSFDEPLVDGTVGVRWMVQAPDAHPISGSFTFTVTVPGGAVASTPEDSLDAFLAADEGSTVKAAERVAAIGRVFGAGGTLLGIGALVFASTVLRSNARDVRHVLFWVRRAGVIIAVGAAVRLGGRIVIDAGGDWPALASPPAIWAALESSTGLAIALRLIGGVLLTAGCRLQLVAAAGRADPVARVRQLVRVGQESSIDDDRTAMSHRSSQPPADQNDVMWSPGSGSMVTSVGALLLLFGYLFDGHTVTEGNRLITATSDLVHVLAAAVWVGGVLMLVSVLRRRHRAEEDLRALYLATRFSVVAAIALVTAGMSGAFLAWVVLDAPSQLWSTPWGRLLVAKTALVVMAAGIGAYNHFVLIPAMEAPAATGHPDRRFRRAVSAEALMLCAVVATTAFLVGAAS